MSTMSDDGDKTCPLCAEEMDLTDQQLKPCRCGYEICVWCWHHLMEMAEKEDSEGRCPACRTPYDKERIVGMAANCERMVAELSIDRKSKSQKVKSKASVEDRKHLDGVRVIKRNLVYIVGLPSNLADEIILERKEYFGQYGKVLKVSISRPTNTTTSQQASNNNTFNVYITYAREEEAIRCIQAVHNFILDGRPLRACFGTTKYCRSWLRNMTCNNPDCLYLHDIGSQEDSFTKDEIISAYTRGWVQQNVSNSLQSGSVLPPPDDWCNNGTDPGKHVSKIATNSNASQVKGAPSISNCGRSTVLPSAASWGSHVPISHQTAANVVSSQNPFRQKTQVVNSLPTLSTIVPSGKHPSAWNDDDADVHEGVHMKGRSTAVQSSRPVIEKDNQRSISDVSMESVLDEACPSAWDDEVVTTSQLSEGTRALKSETLISEIDRNFQTSASDVLSKTDVGSCPISEALVPEDKNGGINVVYAEVVDRRSSSVPVEDSNDRTVNENVQNLSSRFDLLNSDDNIGVHYPSMDKDQISVSNFCSTRLNSNSSSQKYCPEQGIEHIASTSSGRTVSPDLRVTEVSSNWNADSQVSVLVPSGNLMEPALIAADDQRHSSSHVISQPLRSFSGYHPLNVSNGSSNSFWNNDAGSTSFLPVISNSNKSVNTSVERGLISCRENGIVDSSACEGVNIDSYPKHGMILEHPNMNRTEKEVKQSGRFDLLGKTRSVDTRESSIVTDMFSLDFDPWGESFSADNFAKLLGKIDEPDDSSKLPVARKSQNSNQSRFSFARQENEANLLDFSFRNSRDANQLRSSSKDIFVDGIQNDSKINSFMAPNLLYNSNSVSSSDVSSGATATRSKISAPPGFPVPNTPPPPGFSSHDRHGRIYETGNSSILNQHQVYTSGTAGDVEFIDPAILAVGKGILPPGLAPRSAHPSQFGASDTDARLLLFKQSMSTHQEPRITEHSDRLLPPNEAYISSRILAQNHSRQPPLAQILNQQPMTSPHVLNSQWYGWNGMSTGNDGGMAEILRNSRLRINDYFPVNEEHQFHRANSGNQYNRANSSNEYNREFGM